MQFDQVTSYMISNIMRIDTEYNDVSSCDKNDEERHDSVEASCCTNYTNTSETSETKKSVLPISVPPPTDTKSVNHINNSELIIIDSISTNSIINRHTENRQRTINDDNIFGHSRTIEYLLLREKKTTPSINYFNDQTVITLEMRHNACYWMYERTEESNCADAVLPLAINMFDRVLIRYNIQRESELLLIACVCIATACKLRDTPINLERLCNNSYGYVEVNDVLIWEVPVYNFLDYDLNAVTPLDYVAPLLLRLNNLARGKMAKVRQHSIVLAHFASIDSQIFLIRPSIIATASISAAMKGLHIENEKELFNDLIRILYVDPILVEIVRLSIERMLDIISKNPYSQDDHKYEFKVITNDENLIFPTPTENMCIDIN